MKQILIVLSFLIVGFFQGMSLLRQRHSRDLLVFASLWGLALVLSILVTLDVQLPKLFVIISQLARVVTGRSR